jgi:hypothetical protein
MKKKTFSFQSLLLFVFCMGGLGAPLMAQQISPCVNITLHDLAPKINHPSGADITSSSKGYNNLAITMAEWQGIEPAQEYFLKKIQAAFPQLGVKQGHEDVRNYLYATIGITESFSMPALQVFVAQKRTEINAKIQEIGSEQAYQYYYDLVH